MMTTPPMGPNVYDRWWPWRVGVVVKRTKTTTHVCWEDGEVWTYDREHRQFLVQGSPR